MKEVNTGKPSCWKRVSAIALLTVLPVSALALDAPTGPATSADGNYTIHYPWFEPGNSCDYVELEEKPSGATYWTHVPDHNYDGAVEFINKPVGIYEYRALLECENFYSDYTWEITSDSITVQVGNTPSQDSISDQLNYEYEVRYDGGLNFFIKRLTAADPGNGTIDVLMLTATASGAIISRVPTPSEQSSAANWPIVDVDLVIHDFNADGFFDIALKGLGNHVSGVDDQLVFAPGQLFANTPSNVMAMDQTFNEFATDMANYFENENYFDENSQEIETPGYWETHYECNVYYWGDMPEIECESWVEWVDGEEYTIYPGINPDAVAIWEALSSGNDGLVKDILESIFGVVVGGAQWCIELGFNNGSNDCEGIQFLVMTGGFHELVEAINFVPRHLYDVNSYICSPFEDTPVDSGGPNPLTISWSSCTMEQVYCWSKRRPAPRQNGSSATIGHGERSILPVLNPIRTWLHEPEHVLVNNTLWGHVFHDPTVPFWDEDCGNHASWEDIPLSCAYVHRDVVQWPEIRILTHGEGHNRRTWQARLNEYAGKRIFRGVDEWIRERLAQDGTCTDGP